MNRTRMLISALMVLMLASTSLTLSIQTAQAAPSLKHVSFSNTKVTAGQHFTVNYQAKHVPQRGKVMLQRQFGTGHVYKKVAKLNASHTSKRVKAPALGKYVYRVVIKKSGITLAASKPITLVSYGIVRLNTLLHSQSGTKQIGGDLYRYDWHHRSPSNPAYTVRKQNSGSCRWIEFTAAEFLPGGTDVHSGTLSLIQEDADQQSVAIEDRQITPGAKWTLTGHAFKMTFSLDTGGSQQTHTDYLAGKASCWSSNWKTS